MTSASCWEWSWRSAVAQAEVPPQPGDIAVGAEPRRLGRSYWPRRPDRLWLEMGDAALLRPVSYSIWQDDQRQCIELVVFGLPQASRSAPWWFFPAIERLSRGRGKIMQRPRFA